MTDKPSCETCSKRATDICPLSTVANNIGRHGDYERIVSVFRIVGCASHSQAREYLMEPVIEELDRIKTPESKSYDEYNGGVDYGFEIACERAIALIKNGVGGK